MDLLLTGAAAGQSSIIVVVAYVAIIAAFFYFAMVRPQRKERQRMQALYESLAVGDSILTNSGFYGIIIDISDDTVIVEFGNNKNCRIPMQKAAIAQVEKAEEASAKDKD